MTMTVVVPSRGRPESVKRLIQGWVDTEASCSLVFGLDRDDETFNEESGGEINALIEQLGLRGRVSCSVSDPKGMVFTLNEIATGAAEVNDFVGFMGDDHAPRTLHWDRRITETLQSVATGIAYGNDLFQGPNLPTAVFMTSDIIRALGYMAPPQCHHLFVDNAWRDWGQATHRLRYLPDVIIEHLHPQAGKAEWDQGHIRVNAGDMWERDSAAYEEYKASGQLDADIEKIKAL